MTTIRYLSGYEATKGLAISEANLEMPVLYKMLEYHGAWANTFSCSWTDDIAIKRYRGKVPKQVIVLCQKEDKKNILVEIAGLSEVETEKPPEDKKIYMKRQYLCNTLQYKGMLTTIDMLLHDAYWFEKNDGSELFICEDHIAQLNEVEKKRLGIP
jgi:hypothetical protein